MKTIPVPKGYVLPTPPKAPEAPPIQKKPEFTSIEEIRLPANKMAIEETSLVLRRFLHPLNRSNPKVIKFIMAYLECRHDAEASREAGITLREGRAIKKCPDVHEAICHITEKAILLHGFDASDVIARLKEIMDFDPIELENEDGTFKTSLSQIPGEYRRAIKSFKAKNLYGVDANGIQTTIGQLVSVEFYDKIKATELLGPEKGVLKPTKKVEHSMSKDMSNTLLESKRRAEEHTIDVTPKRE